MNIIDGRPADILQLVDIDQSAYGKYGETEEYFRQKIEFLKMG